MKYKHMLYKYIFLLSLFNALKAVKADDGAHKILQRNAVIERVIRSYDMRFVVLSIARFKRDVAMDKKLYVHGKARFDDDVEFKKSVKFKKNLTIKGDLTVTGPISVIDTVSGVVTIENLSVTETLTTNNFSVFDQTVSGTLSATNTVVGCDLTVNCNIDMNNSSYNTSVPQSLGNINKAGNRFIHNLGEDNTFIGVNSGSFDVMGNSNIGVGVGALQSLEGGSSNTVVGRLALNANKNGNDNVAIGSSAMLNTSTNSNIGIGSQALANNRSDGLNTVIGINALQSNVSGSFNVVIGNDAARAARNASSNIIIGSSAASGLTDGDKNIYIGKGVGPTGSESNTIRIGNFGHSRTFIGGVVGKHTGGGGAQLYVDSNGRLGIMPSSRRFKHAIEKIGIESARIYDLVPVSFVYNEDETEVKQYGLIAEDVATVLPALVVNDKDGAPLTVHYESLPVLLLSEMKKQQQRIEELHTELERIESFEAPDVVQDLKNNIQAFDDVCNSVARYVEILLLNKQCREK